MGTRFLEDLGAFSILLPFVFSSDPEQNYVLVLQEGKIRIATQYGFVRGANDAPIEIPSPYLANELYDISFAQSGDIVYMVHYNHPPMKLMRYTTTLWEFEEVDFFPAIQPPTNLTLAFSGAGGGFTLRYKVASVDADGVVSVAIAGSLANAKPPSDWVVGDYATLTWTAAENAESYNIYREEAGVFGLIGVAVDGATKFRDDKYIADTTDTPSVPQNPFTNDNNPSFVCFHQQRLVYGGPRLEPQKWYASRTGSFDDFSRSRPVKDDDSLEYMLASGRIDVIQWMADFGDLLIGTAGGEFKATGPDGGTITPSSLNVRQQSYWGSVRLRPLILGNTVLHVQRLGIHVRDLFYSLEKDGYSGNDLSVLATHLFDWHAMRQWTYQQSPGSIVWCIRGDGMMLALAYMKEHDIWGWTRITTEGKWRSVCSVCGHYEDELYAVAEREVNGETRWYLEKFENTFNDAVHDIKDAFFVDSGLTYNDPANPVDAVHGLEHLEGCKVSILADGSPCDHVTVENGAVSVPYEAGIIHVGLPYASYLCPQTPESDNERQGSTLGRVRNYGTCKILLRSSVGGEHGPSREELYKLPHVPEYYNEPVKLFTGWLDFHPSASYGPEGKVWIAQKDPLPFTVEALVLDVDIKG